MEMKKSGDLAADRFEIGSMPKYVFTGSQGMSNPIAGQSGRVAATTETALAIDQQKALEHLLTGQSVAEAAQLAGISRATLYRWLRHDAAFGAAYNQWQDQLQEGCRSRLLTLGVKAAAAVEKALDNGDAKTALQLLKGMGLLSPRPVGLTDADELREQAQLEKEERRGKRQEKKWTMRTVKEVMG
jgi:hypothetical protein